MADDTDWQTLRDKCAANQCYLSCRVETFNKGAEYRYSLAAINRLGRTIYDLRSTSSTNAPQFIITGLVTQALDQWWAPMAAASAPAE